MFIGEMGSWLVLGGVFLYRVLYLRSKDAPLLYQPVNTEDPEDDEPLRPTRSRDAASPALKPLVPNNDDRTPLTGYKISLLALPACCDITGTTLMNVGLLFVAASIYQMTRGALVLFVGLFSVLFLKRKLFLYHWLSLFIVVLGVALVGLAGAIYSGDKNSPSNVDQHDLLHTSLLVIRDAIVQASEPAVLRTVLGIFLIAFAQIFTATQFVLEEWILENYALEPLRVVAWEGLFGFTVTILLQIILHFTVGVSAKGKYGYFDAEEGYRQMFSNRAIGITSLAIMVSIGGFNFFGLSVTRSISATSRSIIDTCRTLFIWIVSLGLGWETFKWLQVLGFVLVSITYPFYQWIRTNGNSSWFMEHSCSTILSNHPSKLFYPDKKNWKNAKTFYPKILLNICRHVYLIDHHIGKAIFE
jgi:drug/metabolite transporter (DMT)-like permease